MKANSEQIKSLICRLKHKEILLTAAFVSGLLLSVAERFLYQKLFNDYLEFYIGSIICVIASFSLSMVRNAKHGGFIGKNLSLGIYLIHPIVIRCLNLVDELKATHYCSWYSVMTITLFLSLVIHLISSIKRTLHSLSHREFSSLMRYGND
jgi:hypothetical protein